MIVRGQCDLRPQRVEPHTMVDGSMCGRQQIRKEAMSLQSQLIASDRRDWWFEHSTGLSIYILFR